MMIVYCSILFGGYYNEPLNHLLNGGSKGPTLQLEEPLSEQCAGREIDLEYLHVAAGHITHHSPEFKASFASVILAWSIQIAANQHHVEVQSYSFG